MQMLASMLSGPTNELDDLFSFVQAGMSAVREKGIKRALEQWLVPLPDDPSIDPWDHRLTCLAVGFGFLMAPCICVELSANPDGGLTRLALPFMTLFEPEPGNKDPRDLVERMLSGLGSVVWRLTAVHAGQA